MSLESFFLTGSAGRIECLLKLPSSGAGAAGAAVVCHPHPLFGGTMHSKVVHATATSLSDRGLPVLRFNFRSAGLSEGTHDGGQGEVEDLVVVLDELARRFPSRPLLVAGYSFGAWVALRAGCSDRRVAALIAVGLPVALYDVTFVQRCGKPLAVIQGDRDAFGPMPALRAIADPTRGLVSLLTVHGAEHDFAGHLETLRERVKEALPGAPIW